MVGPAQQKILGACVLGVAFVAIAYLSTNFGKGKDLPAGVGAVAAPARVAVKVEDKDNNGIEDWRDPFLTAEPVILNQAASSSYELPTTLTGRLGINFFQNYVVAKNSRPVGRSDQEVINDTAKAVEEEVRDTIYNTRDITVMQTWTDADVKNYANAMGGILLSNKAPDHENEIYILKDVVDGRKERLSELKVIEDDYHMFRDGSLKVPVPALFVKQHLDLINTYNALYKDLAGMNSVNSDPILALMRIQRYQDDSVGLGLALTNMYRAFQPYSTLFGQQDAAIFFSNFDPNNLKP